MEQLEENEHHACEEQEELQRQCDCLATENHNISAHKELRFAILLPFSASSDAENGRLSANFICHAPAPFDHAPADALLLPQATHMWAPTSLVPKRAHQSLQCHSAPSWGGQKWPPSATRQLDSGQRLAAVAIFPN